MSKCIRLAVGLAVMAVALAAPQPANANDLAHKRQEAARIAARLEQLQGEAFELGGALDEAEQGLAAATAEVTQAEGKLATLESQLSALRSSAKQVAIRAYIDGGRTDGLTLVLGDQAGPADAIPRDIYVSLALGAQVGAIDELGAVTEDTARQRDELAVRRAAQERLQRTLADRQQQVDRALVDYRTLQSQVQGELASLVAAEQARRARAIAEQARTQSDQTRSADPSRRSTQAASPGGAAAQPVSGPRPGANVPPPSPGAGGAVAAAMSQVGVPYRFAAASPGVAFDCSGLTLWAWAQAGVSLPHQSRAQAAMLPAVSQDQVRPGDLIFYYAPIGHVAMYIGNGQLVHATRPGDVVKVATVRWDRVAYIGRPG